jgi:hypothetical protein
MKTVVLIVATLWVASVGLSRAQQEDRSRLLPIGQAPSLRHPVLPDFLDPNKDWLSPARLAHDDSILLRTFGVGQFFDGPENGIVRDNQEKTFKGIFVGQAGRIDSPPADPGKAQPVQAPIGRVGYPIGTYLTIEGVRAEQGRLAPTHCRIRLAPSRSSNRSRSGLRT